MSRTRKKEAICIIIKQIASVTSEGYKYTTVEITKKWGNGCEIKKKPESKEEENQLWLYNLVSDITSMLKHLGICKGDSKNTIITREAKNLTAVKEDTLWEVWRAFESCSAAGTECPPEHSDSNGNIKTAWRMKYDKNLQNAVEKMGLDMNNVWHNYHQWIDKKERALNKRMGLGIVAVQETEEERKDRLRQASLENIEEELLQGTVSLGELPTEMRKKVLEKLW